jgi:integrase
LCEFNVLRTADGASFRVYLRHLCPKGIMALLAYVGAGLTLAVHERPRLKSRAEVLGLVKDRIRLLHYAYSTEDVYCHWIGRYYDFCLTQSQELPPERKAEAFLTLLAARLHVAAKTQNQAFASVLFLYKEVLKKPLGEIHALRAKRPIHERTSPSREQVRLLRGAVEDTSVTPARLLVDLLYGCGMRVSEPVELRIKDVLWAEGPSGHLMIRGAKGGKDRRVPIPRSCVEPLKAQIERSRDAWKRDRADSPGVGVTLPGGLHVKYPTAPFAWQWFWVFPAERHCEDPRLQIRVHYHLLSECIQRAVLAAARKVELEGLISSHSLRHAYATHSRETVDALSKLLGHSSIVTTAGYRHAVVDRASNPLDDMLGAG